MITNLRMELFEALVTSSDQVQVLGAHLAGVPAPPPPGEVAPGAEEGGVELEPGAQPGLAEAGLGRAGVAALVYVHDHYLVNCSDFKLFIVHWDY